MDKHKPRHRVRDFVFSAIFLTVGALIAAFAIEEFLSPNQIFDGGIIGVSMIIAHMVKVPMGVLVTVINIPFLIYALKHIGHAFLFKAAYSMVLFSVVLSPMEKLVLPIDDPLLATVFGGVVLGIGVGMVLRGGGCLDGTEIVAIIINRRTAITVGKVILVINIVIYAVAGYMFGIEYGLYSMLMYYITSKVIDIVEIGWDEAKAIMVITDDGRLVADEIYKNFGRTVTFIRGEGFISNSEKDILYCVVTRAEIYDLRKLIDSLDVSSFTTITDVSEIIGTHIKGHGK